jgi:hypothetical protein
MQLREFGQQHRLRVRRSRQDDTDTIIGKHGEIYDFDEDKLAVMVLPDPPRRGLWVRCRAKFLALGMTVIQNGDQEGAATFDPTNQQRAKAAIQAIRARRVQKLSPERQANLLIAGQGTRLKAGHMAQNGV